VKRGWTRRDWLLGGLGLCAGTGGLAWYRQRKRYNHFEVHDPGLVYRSAWLDADVFAELISQYQIRSIVNLCNPDEMGRQRCVDERAAVEGSGAILHDATMPNTIDPADPQVARLVEILANPSNYPLLVHCQHGVTRTAKFLAMYDILYRHLSADESLARMPVFGHGEYTVSVYAFARNFEQQHAAQYPQAAGALEQLRR
jgi:hypothetical protein